MASFDEKFGKNLIADLPQLPGVYRFLNRDREIVYVGKAKNLKRRLSQYKNAKRRKKHRKMKLIVQSAVHLEFETCPTEMEALLLETQLIQSSRPKWNVAGAFYFLYPLIGLRVAEDRLSLCYTTEPDLWGNFDFHGAFRSRFRTRTAFLSLLALLKYIGHRTKDLEPKRRYSILMTFRQIHTESIHGLRSFLKGEPSDFLENLTLTLLENAGARSNGKEVQEHLKNIQDFWRHEARPLFEVRQKTRTSMYPVSQKDRDLLFLKAKSGSLESPDWVHST